MKDKIEYNREHFTGWYKSYHSQSVTPDQFTGFHKDNDKFNNPNLAPPYSKEKESEIWNKINCGRSSW